MIGYLSGIVHDSALGECTILVSGVGYRVSVVKVFSVGDEVSLYIYTHVREDNIQLFGFENKSTRELFEMLLSVNGVGPRVALAILSAHTSGDIKKALSDANVSFFAEVTGIGKKTAQKIIIDLKSKVGSLNEIDLGDESDTEIAEALIAMGYDKRKVKKELAKLDPELADEEKIKLAIQVLSM